MNHITLESRVENLERQIHLLLPIQSTATDLLEHYGLTPTQALELRTRLLTANPDYNNPSMDIYDKLYGQDI